MIRLFSHFAVLVAVLIGSGCSNQAATPAITVPVQQAHGERVRIEKLSTQHLPNAVRVHAKVISGGRPEGRAAFEELKSLGVKTVISVDGAQPDLATAELAGLRYVHLPHGYDGIPGTRAIELAKAVRDLPGPIYIHCHHGKHRSPAAAAVACVGAGMIEPADALSVLKIAGTSEHYRGLFESTQSAHPVEQELLDKLGADFPATAKLPVMAEAMVSLERTHDHLISLAAAGWKPLPYQPDLLPAHEALLLREHFTELLRTAAARQRPQRFQMLLQAGETHARDLEDGLRKWSASNTETGVPVAVSRSFAAVNDNCRACHQKFRDIPLTEKGRE